MPARSAAGAARRECESRPAGRDPGQDPGERARL